MALNAISTNFSIDFYNNKYILINAKQNDDKTRKLVITCYNQGELFPINSTSYSAYVRYRKSNGDGGLASCTISSKTVTVTLTKEMLSCEGICEVDLIIIEKGSAKLTPDTAEIIYFDNDCVLSTMTFYLNVSAATTDDTVLEYSSDYQGFVEALQRADAEFQDVVTLAKSYSEGGTGRRDGENTDNSKYYSKLSKSYTHGGTNLRTGENTDNAKHYYEQSESYAVGGTGRREGEDTDNSKHYYELTRSYTVGDNGKRNDEEIDNAYYYYQMSESYAKGDSEIKRNNEDFDNALHYSELSKSYAIGDTGRRTGEDTNNAKYFSELAKNSEEAAQSSEEAAQSSEDNALIHATQSQRYAIGGTGTINGEDEDNSKYYYEQAAISASNASKSESNASTSEDNASNYMSEAQNYATQSQRYAVGGTGTVNGEDEDNSKYYCNKALESASNIEANADVISNAATIATSHANAAAESASAAAGSADLASDSADLASDSASAANASATSAFASETNASASANEAHTYCLQVEEIATGLSGAFMPMGTIEFAELATLLTNGEIQAGYLYNISNNFTTDESFKRGAGIEYAAGTNVYYTSEGYFDCLSSTAVFGVKGDKETEYRQGNVNITVENIGAISLEDIVTIDEMKSYLGI